MRTSRVSHALTVTQARCAPAPTLRRRIPVCNIRPHGVHSTKPFRGRRAEAVRPIRPGQHDDERVHRSRARAGPRDERDPRRGQRLPRAARRHDHRRHLPGGGDRHGHPAPVEGLDPRRELRPNRRLHRRVGGGGRHLHDSGVRDPQALEVRRREPDDRVPHVVRADGPRRRARHHVRHDPAPRDGGGPDAAVPRVGGGQRDPQGRAARHRCRQRSCSRPWASARCHQADWRPRHLRREELLPPRRRRVRQEHRPARPDEDVQHGAGRRHHHDRGAGGHARPTSASATSSGRNSAR